MRRNWTQRVSRSSPRLNYLDKVEEEEKQVQMVGHGNPEGHLISISILSNYQTPCFP